MPERVRGPAAAREPELRSMEHGCDNVRVARGPSGESVLTRVNRILSSFDADAPTLSVAEIARRATLPIATAHRLVDELVELRYLERTAGRRVRVGLRLWELGSR